MLIHKVESMYLKSEEIYLLVETIVFNPEVLTLKLKVIENEIDSWNSNQVESSAYLRAYANIIVWRNSNITSFKPLIVTLTL